MCGIVYKQLLQEGLEFQDFISEKLYDRGIILMNYSSKKYGYLAENKLGVEIKLDRNFRTTNNLYIETAEKTDPNNDRYVPSGIYRKDNSWLYLIGDEKTVYIFAKKHLPLAEKKCRSVETPTSQGFLLPIEKAEKWCILKLEFDDGLDDSLDDSWEEL